MKKEIRHSQLEVADTTLICPQCNALHRIGRIGIRTGIDKTPAIDGMECELMLPNLSDTGVVLYPARISEFMHPAYWERSRPLLSASCEKDRIPLIAVDTELAPLVGMCNDYGLYVKDASTSFGERKRGYIKFFRPLPFWVWGVWRNLTLEVLNPAYALELVDNGTAIIFRTGGSDIGNIAKRMQDALSTLTWDDTKGNIPLLDDYGTLVKVIIPTMYDMCIADTEDTVKANIDSPVELVGITGGPYPGQFRFPAINNERFLTLSTWLDQVESFVWSVWHYDDMDNPEHCSAYEAFKEILNGCSSVCYEPDVKRDELGRRYIPAHPDRPLDLRAYGAMAKQRSDPEYAAELRDFYEYENTWFDIRPYSVADKPESERTKWERTLDQIMAVISGNK